MADETTNEIFLWSHPVSSFAQKVVIALREKNIPFKFAVPKGGGTGNAAIMEPSFLEGNQRLEVPVLIDGGIKIFDSTIIFEYLEDKYPDVPLRPAVPIARARARMVEDVCDAQYEAINWGMGELTAYRRARDEKAQKMKDQAKHQVKQIHAWLTEQLGDAKWFGGDKFGWADVCVWPMVNRSTSYNLEPELESPLRQWYERAKQRPAVKSVWDEFTAAVGGAAAAAAADVLRKGLMRRQYRDHRLEWMVKSGGSDIVLDGLQKNNIRFNWPDPQQ